MKLLSNQILVWRQQADEFGNSQYVPWTLFASPFFGASSRDILLIAY